MKKIALERLDVGLTALMMIGTPVRQWIRRVRGGSRQWLTPVRYTPKSQDRWEPSGEPRFVTVEIAAVLLPYVIVYHHDCHGPVKLWLDTRKAGLFAAED